MIKVALKHYIYEACIKVFFEHLTSNFKENPYSFEVGKIYRRLTVKQPKARIELEYCKIMSVNNVHVTFYADIYTEYDAETGNEVSHSYDDSIRWSALLDEIVEVIP